MASLGDGENLLFYHLDVYQVEWVGFEKNRNITTMKKPPSQAKKKKPEEKTGTPFIYLFHWLYMGYIIGLTLSKSGAAAIENLVNAIFSSSDKLLVP